MTVRIYRFRLQNPCINLDQIATEIGVSVSISDYSGGVTLDVACEEANASELIDSMVFRGFQFVIGDPSDSSEDQFKSDNNIVQADGANIGTGEEVFRDKTWNTLNFKTLSSGPGISLEGTPDEVIVRSTDLDDRHRTLRHLIHFIDEGPGDGFVSGSFKVTAPSGSAFPTSIIWYTDSGETEKIVEKLITRAGGGATNLKPTPITWIMYDEDGETAIAKVMDDIVYDGLFEYQRTRTIKILSFTSNETVASVDGLLVT